MNEKTFQDYYNLSGPRDDDFNNAWTDERGVKYSADKKRLLKAPKELSGEYKVLPGTEVICVKAFRFVENKLKVILPDGLKIIGEDALSSVEPVDVPSSVEYLGKWALTGRDILSQESEYVYKKFTFPKSLKCISMVQEIPGANEYTSESPDFPIVNNCLISNDKLICYLGKEANVVIPDCVKIIGAAAFSNNKKIIHVTIPSSVTIIEENAFDFSTLQSVEIPDSVTQIGQWAFNSCHSLKHVVLPNSLKEIQKFTFGNCESLEGIVIPESVKVIGAVAFARCSSLLTINILGNPLIENGAFSGCPGYLDIKNKD